ncbi:MAG TPA: TlpA disulfide reductase family protein [Burkholderiaceae bacterium]|nr:TlpA disulfide reductase family protein [Burkholderiaceae bacterium]
MQPVALARLRGHPTGANFWATWCPPCVEEMPELSDISDKFRVRRLQVVRVGIDSASNIGQFTRKTPVRYPLLVAGNSGLALMRRLGNTAGALPFTVVLARDGSVA